MQQRDFDATDDPYPRVFLAKSAEAIAAIRDTRNSVLQRVCKVLKTKDADFGGFG